MTTLKEYRDVYVTASLKAGDISRQLGFAGIALIWIFKTTSNPTSDIFSLPNALYLPALLIILSLVFDLMQYIIKAAIWGWVQRHLEKKFSPDTSKNYMVSEWFNAPTIALYWLKLIVMVFAYILIFQFVSTRVHFETANSKYQTLYRNSVTDTKMRLHVTTFDTEEGQRYNKENCEQAQALFQKQPGVKTQFWCEPGRYIK